MLRNNKYKPWNVEQLIDSVYTALEAVAVDDTLVMARICARRAFILRVGYSDYVGARQTLTQAIGMIHADLDRLICRGANEVGRVSQRPAMLEMFKTVVLLIIRGNV
jgi:hypothetical protein